MSKINPHCIGEEHAIAWADDGMIGYLCPNDPKGTPGQHTGMHSMEDGDLAACDFCKAELRFIYVVQIKET